MGTLTGDPTAVPAADAVDEAGTAPGDRRFRPDVEGLRAVAVVLVVLYHAGLPGLSGGFVGVDVFFVISGFVITGLLLRERATTDRTSLRSFYGRRVRRILPAATLVIVTTVVATYAVLGLLYGNPTAVAARWTAVFLANVHFADLGTDYLSAQQPPSPLQNFWSLAVEEQFYLVYPAIVLLVASLRSSVALRIRLAVALVPIIAGSFLISVLQTASSPTGAFFSPFARAWELALGALVAAATPALLRLPRQLAGCLTWAGLAAIGSAAVAYSSTTPYPGSLVAVPVVGTALVIAGGTPVPRSGAEAVLRLAPFQWFGRLSYSLYLWHWPILIIAAEAAGHDGLPFHQNLGWLALALLVAYATHRLVENPVRHARVLARRPWLPIGFGLALVATSLVVATGALNLHGEDGGLRTYRGVVPLSAAAVTHLVDQAPSIVRVPGDLTPTLADVPGNWGGPPAGCSLSYAQTSGPACVFGDPQGRHTVVLYGDSHAEMWFTAVDRITREAGWRLVLLAKSACPAVDLPFANPPGHGTPSGTFTACATWHRTALRRIQVAHPDLVIVTQNPDLGPHGRVYTTGQWLTATEALVRALPVPAARVTVLGDIPAPPEAGPTCVSLHPDDVQRCSGPNTVYAQQRGAVEELAAALTGARYIDTQPWFCSTTCTDVIGRYLPYWDSVHMTLDYSIVLSGVLGQALDLGRYAPTAVTAPTP